MNFSFKTETNRVVLFGASGCGKSTLLKMIAGFVKPDKGEIYFDNQCLFSKLHAESNVQNLSLKFCNKNIPVYKRNFGYLPQENTLFPNMTVKENIVYGLKTQKLPFNNLYFDNIIDRLRIRHKLDSMPATLSGGQMQRVALARVLMIRPKLLLLDEPFSALDTPVKECLKELVINLADEINIPIIFVTHDVEDAFIVGKEIVVLDNGKIIEYGLVENIYNSPSYIETARLLDYKNIFPISLIRDNEIVLSNGFKLSLKDKKIPEDAEFVCIKPNNILVGADKEMLHYDNRFDGVIKDISYRGKYIRALFQAVSGFLLDIHLSQFESAFLKLKKGEKACVVLKQDTFVLCKKSKMK